MQDPFADYQDFVLKIERVGDVGAYRVEAQGPTGEATADFTLPFSPLEIENFLLRVGHPRSARHRGRVPEPVQHTLDFGGELFDAVVCGEVRDILMSARQDAESDGHGLRIQVRLNDAPEFAYLPWEFLFDGHDFLALSAITPLVRYLELSKPRRPLAVALPLRMLVTISTPPICLR